MTRVLFSSLVALALQTNAIIIQQPITMSRGQHKSESRHRPVALKKESPMPMSPSEVTNAFAKIYNMTNEALTSSLLDNAWKTMKAASSNTKEPAQSGLLQVEKDEYRKSQHDSEDHKKGEKTSRQEDGEKAKADTNVSKPAKLVDPWGGGGT